MVVLRNEDDVNSLIKAGWKVNERIREKGIERFNLVGPNGSVLTVTIPAAPPASAGGA